MPRKEVQDLPPAYTTLFYDDESGAGPSAPTTHISLSDKDEDESGAVLSAPPIYESPSVTGIQQELTQPTAPPAEWNPEPPPLPPLIYNAPSLVFEDIYDACVKYIKGYFCYGSRFINRMRLTEIANRGVYHYKLESFGEKRESKYVTVAYRGGSYDGPENGPPPNHWDIPASPPHLFKDCRDEKTIPHTTTIHDCSICDGDKEVACRNCHGKGYNDCNRCYGRGEDLDNVECSLCSGSGRRHCSSCSGSGKVTCSHCDGYGEVKKYRVLVLTWKNHTLEFVTNTDNLPRALIKKAQGATLLTESAFALQPLQNAPDVTANAASVTMLQRHRSSFPSERIIRQRHVLRGVPFTRVKYAWSDKEGEFYIYGNNRDVYFEDYPQKYCCCTCC